MKRWLATQIFRLFGWRVENEIPADLKKFVLIAAPHTSWWDFFVGILSRAVIDRDIRFLGKKSLFKPPFGWILRALGGYPVDRQQRHNLVEQVVRLFQEHEHFAIALAPEGTRRKVERFKTGFYYIARGAGVPIIMAQMDYGNRVVRFSRPFYPTAEIEADMQRIWEHFKGIRGKRPELGID
ncbi:MAG: lysophospholipid acyltransferase family protein [Saprospiraceae bacterium]|nr:lysophospholipid acyltransferase family protein [Saprospiraceae bacterium]